MKKKCTIRTYCSKFDILFNCSWRFSKTNLMVTGIVALLLAIASGFVANTSGGGKQESFVDCIQRINQNDLMFDIKDMGSDHQSLMGTEIKSLMKNLKAQTLKSK